MIHSSVHKTCNLRVLTFLLMRFFFFIMRPSYDSTKAGQRQKEVINQVNVKLIMGLFLWIIGSQNTVTPNCQGCHTVTFLVMCVHVAPQMLEYIHCVHARVHACVCVCTVHEIRWDDRGRQ